MADGRINRCGEKAMQRAVYGAKLQRTLRQAGTPKTREEYIRNMATLQYGHDPSPEEMDATAESLGHPKKVPKYIQSLEETDDLHLLAPATEEEILKNDALEMLEDEEDKGTRDEERYEKRALSLTLEGMRMYKEKDNTKMFFHLMYNREIKNDIEKVMENLGFDTWFSCRCITSKGQIHYHVMVAQLRDTIKTKDSLLYHFKKARALGEWPVKAYQITHIKSDYHFVNACIYMCLIKAGRDHGPHSERLIPMTEMAGKRVWNQVAEKYPNLYKEKHDANEAYHLRMKKSKIYVDNV